MLSCQNDRSVLLYRGMATLTSSKIIHHGLIQNLAGIVSSVLMKRAKECMFCINRVANLSRRTRPSAPSFWCAQRDQQVLTALGGSAAFYVHLEREKRRVLAEKRNPQAKGEAAIGGEFELVNTEGTLFHSDGLKGNWCIL